MPYVKDALRLKFNPQFTTAPDCGVLNFQITQLIKAYWDADNSYQSINDIVGALEGAKLEFTRRVTNTYEDSKIKQNGDIYV